MSGEVHRMMGRVRTELRQPNEAVESYRVALAVDSTYKKASSSLARVEQRVDDPSVSPIDLTHLAETFDREIRSSVVVRQP